MSRYRDAGTEVFEICNDVADICERTSIDEAYLDITESARKLLSNTKEYERRMRTSGVLDSVQSRLAEMENDGMDYFWKSPLNPSAKEEKFSDHLLAAGAIIVSELR